MIGLLELELQLIDAKVQKIQIFIFFHIAIILFLVLTN